MNLPKELDLLNASYSLPFCKPQDFDSCWDTIVSSIAIGGRFSGHFFYGPHDDLANNPDITIHPYEALMNLFQDQFMIANRRWTGSRCRRPNETLACLPCCCKKN